MGMVMLLNQGQDIGDADRSTQRCFKILDVDKVDEAMQMSLAGIEQIAHHAQQFSAS